MAEAMEPQVVEKPANKQVDDVGRVESILGIVFGAMSIVGGFCVGFLAVPFVVVGVLLGYLGYKNAKTAEVKSLGKVALMLNIVAAVVMVLIVCCSLFLLAFAALSAPANL